VPANAIVATHTRMAASTWRLLSSNPPCVKRLWLWQQIQPHTLAGHELRKKLKDAP